MNKLTKVALAFIFITVAGCVPNWKPVEPGAYVKEEGFSIVLPEGWLQLEGMDKNSIVASTDGPSLQSFAVVQKDLKKAFETTKVEVDANTLTYELMEYYIAEYKANSGDQVIEVESKEAAEMSGKDGFKVVLLYKNQEGLRFKQVTYGCMDESKLYLLSYHAPVLYYFDKNVADFESSARTFQIL